MHWLSLLNHLFGGQKVPVGWNGFGGTLERLASSQAMALKFVVLCTGDEWLINTIFYFRDFWTLPLFSPKFGPRGKRGKTSIEFRPIGAPDLSWTNCSYLLTNLSCWPISAEGAKNKNPPTIDLTDRALICKENGRFWLSLFWALGTSGLKRSVLAAGSNCFLKSVN